MPWTLPADGARRARSISPSTTSAETGASVNARTMRRRRMASRRSIHAARREAIRRGRSPGGTRGGRGCGAAPEASNDGGLRELGEVFGHRPAEGDQRVAPLGVEALEERRHVLVDALGLEALVVEDLGEVAVALGHERPVVVRRGVDTEALGQAPTPRALLTARLVIGAGDDVV